MSLLRTGSTRQTIASERITNDSQPQGKEASRSKGPRNEPGRSTDRTSEEELQSQQVSERRKSKKEPSWGADKNNEDNVQERKNNNPKMEEVATELENIDLDEQSRDYRYISERDSIYCLPPRRMIALYDYDPAVSSPNVDSEVGFLFLFIFNRLLRHFLPSFAIKMPYASKGDFCKTKDTTLVERNQFTATRIDFTPFSVPNHNVLFSLFILISSSAHKV